VTASRIARTNIRKMRIFQPGSYINVDFANRKVMTIHLNDEIQANGAPGQDVEVTSFPASDALKDEIVHFVECVRTRSEPLVSGRVGRHALDVALQVMAQIRENQDLEVYRHVAAALQKR
jgi:predicted dehydrogenase